MSAFIEEARLRSRSDEEMPYNGKKAWLAARLPGFLDALADPELEATAITQTLADKGHVVPYRTVKRWCNNARGIASYG